MPRRDRLNRIVFAACPLEKRQTHNTKTSNASKLDGEYLEKFTTCQCSYKKLKMPVIISRLGKLYNKEELYELIIDRTKHDPKDQSTDFQKALTKKLKRIKEIRTSKDFWEIEKVHYNPLYVDDDDNEQGSNSNSTRNENASFLKTLGVAAKSSAVSIDKSMIATAGSQEKFPFACSMTNYTMNGTHKFVFGLKSKSLVSEKALIECNLAALKKNRLEAQSNTEEKDDQPAATAVDKNLSHLHAIYQEKNEKILICPMTGEEFGRPMLLYPFSPGDVYRAESYQPSKGKAKKRKNSGDKGEIEGKVSK